MFGKVMAAASQAPLLFNVAPVVVSAASSSEEQEEIKVIVERNVPVPMRDVTILRADIHRPDRGGPYPVLVQRTLGGKDGNFDRFVKAGYIVVIQDVRGWGASEGERNLLHIERYWSEDGYVTVEWAAKLPGSTGKVGTFGRSNAAQQQWRQVSLCPPSLVAMSAQSGIAPGRHHEQTGTIRPYSFLHTIIIYYVPHDRRLTNRPGVHTSWEASKLWERGESKKWVEWLPLLDLPRDLLQNKGYNAKRRINDPQWAPGAIVAGCKNISVPNFDVTGWYDHCNSDMLWFRKMVSEAKTEVARKGSKIIIGPWLHGRIRRHIGPIDFGPDATLDNTALQIRWFDYWLKGIQNGVDKEPPVRIFVMGDNKWRGEQHWPPQRIEERILYITSNGRANTPTGDGKLAHQEPGQAGKDQYLYDLKDPVPTLSDPRMLFMPADQRPLAGRKDILVYQTEPLRERVEVTGNPVVELYASSSAPDTDWFVRLIDVAPDGLAWDVSSGVVRARYRDGFDKPMFIEPGKVVKYSIRMRPTSNAFLPGHRIRLDITSSDFPNYDRNHNTAVNQNADATLVVANQTIFHGGDYATRIILPWVPNPPKEEKPEEEEKVEQEPEKRTYPLHQAAASGDIEQVRMLISKGSNINSEDEEKNTPLCCAVKADNMEMTKLLVDAGAEVNRESTGGQLPLYMAVKQNNIAITEYLIAHGANVNVPEGWTALQEAVYIDNNIEMIKLLIAKGADINAGPWTPLHGAVSSQRGRDIVELLIRKGADVNAKGRDDSRSTPLLVALRRNNEEIAELLIANGAEIGDLGLKDERGLTTLHNAAVEGHKEVAELLLSKGAKVDERDDNYEFAALHYAARFGNKNVAEVLIAHGADIKAKDKWAYEPIHWAAYHDRPEIIELLIAKGADVNVKTSLGQTPLELAIPRRNTGAIEVLRKHRAKEPEEASSETGTLKDAVKEDKIADPNNADAKKPQQDASQQDTPVDPNTTDVQ